VRYAVEKATLPPGKYRSINGNYAIRLGLLAAAEKSGLPLFFGGYPITPASEILHFLASYRNFGVKTFQAEDEIAGVSAAIGASFIGNLACTATSGPGMALKTEALGLAIMAELPLVVVNVQRGGPSTGLPTKTEQSDLFQAVMGRNADAPIPVIAPSTPGDCFYTAYEASQIAIKYMTPVIVLSDGYLANGSEPWHIPKMAELPKIDVKFETEYNGKDKYLPYKRNKQTLARPWAIPGTPKLEHRLGGLEKEDVTGDVNYEADNHHLMTTLRAQKIANVANDYPPTKVFGKDNGDLLILTWGSTFGPGRVAVERLHKENLNVSHVHLRYLNPLPIDLGGILKKFKHILIPEINTGQLRTIIRAEYIVNAEGLNIVRGRPIRASMIVNRVKKMLGI
jgi:2-oxoglutarate ferredoxin oxidoreductase subunit alpha